MWYHRHSYSRPWLSAHIWARCICLLAVQFVWIFAEAAQAGTAGFPHHHLHNFPRKQVDQAAHAVEMDYQFVTSNRPEGSAYEKLGVIRLHNLREIPILIFEDPNTGDLYVSYRDLLHTRGTDLNPLATMHGLSRTNGKMTAMTAEDLELIKTLSGQLLDATGLTLATTTADSIQTYFSISYRWTNYKGWSGLGVLVNWESKKVVNEMYAASTTNFPWENYTALFLDAMGLVVDYDLVNSDQDGDGVYATWSEGQLDFVQRITSFVRDIKRTGQPQPYSVFGNFWDPKISGSQKTTLRWYGEDLVRLDHYYYERGGLGRQVPNGVVPGTREPAYVDPLSPQNYVPANRVSLDDDNSYIKDLSGVDPEVHFAQHLDAAGTAGQYGAWFGWYGSDYINRRYSNGQLLYTNDLQLLRAMPNWDNMVGIAIVPFGTQPTDAERRWDGVTYSSSNSYANAAVIASRHPDTEELFVVFRSMSGSVPLAPNEQLESAVLVNDWFAKTAESVVAKLMVTNQGLSLLAGNEVLLGRGMRVTFLSPAPSDGNVPSSDGEPGDGDTGNGDMRGDRDFEGDPADTEAPLLDGVVPRGRAVPMGCGCVASSGSRSIFWFFLVVFAQIYVRIDRRKSLC